MLTRQFSCLWPCVCLGPEAFVKEAEISVFWTGSQCPTWSENHSLALNAAAIEGGKVCFTVCPPWVNHTPEQPQHLSPIPNKSILTPKVPTTRSNLAGSYSRGGEGREGRANKPSTHFRTSPLCVLDKIGFLGWGHPANSVPPLNKKDSVEPQIKDECIRHSISQFSAHYKLLLHLCEEKKKFICSLAHRKDIIIIRINTNSYGTFSVRIH